MNKGPFGFIQGWNTKASVTTLPENSMCDAQNVNIVYGDLVKRKGSAYINSPAISGTPAVHGISDWRTAAGQNYLVVTAGTKIFQTADLGATLTDITGATTITSGANNQHTFCSLNNFLIICGGTTPDAPLQWTGTGNASALAGSPPSGNICATANNFAFISGIAANPSRVYWSNVIDPNTWSASNYAEFRASDGDNITALCEMDQNLVIFKRKSIGLLWTIPPSSLASVTLGPLTQVIVGVGCPGPLCVDKLDDGRIVFLGTNAHVYIFDGSTIQDISDREPPDGSIQPTLDAINVSRLKNSVVRFYPNRREIWISVSEAPSSTNNAIYVYSLIYNCWESKFVGILANVMCSSLDTRATPSHPVIMLTGTYGGYVTEQDTGNVNAEASGGVIDGYGTTSILTGVDRVDFIPKSGLFPIESNGNTNLELNYGFNGYTEVPNSVLITQNNGAAVLDSFILDTDAVVGPATIMNRTSLYTNGRVNSVQIQFRNRNSGQDFTAHSFFLSDQVIA